jgi:digeranylgeranylglycerophospholipid reductase
MGPMPGRRDTDVLVVGGGPGGLMAATTAAASGRSVILVERQGEIGEPVHTSGATAPETMRHFEIPASLYHPLSRIRFRSPHEEAVFEYPEPVLCVIDVRGVYRHLAARAAAAGAEVLTGHRADEPLMEDGRVLGCAVTTPQEGPVEFAARVVVDASGYRASISKQAGLHDGFSRFGVGAEYDLVAPNCRQDELVLVVGSRYAPAGYAWFFPWGDGRVRVGTGIHHADVREDPKALLDVLVEDAASLGVDLSGRELAEYHYGLVPADGMPDRLVGDGIMAVGDAACQATLVVGEGIRLSMAAGELAGATARDAVAAGCADRDALLPYEREFRSRYGRSLSLGHLVNRRLAAYDDGEWDEKARLLHRIPASLLPQLLQSEISARSLVRHPRLWPHILRYGARYLTRSPGR